MQSRAPLFILVVIAGAAACGGPSNDNYSDPAGASGKAMSGGSGKGGSSATGGKGGSNATGGKGGNSGTSGSSSTTGGTGGGSGSSGTAGDETGGTGNETGGTGNETGGTGNETGGTGNETGGTGGTGTETGGAGGMGGTGMETGGAGGSRAGAGGKGGSGGSPDCEALAEQYAKALEQARQCNADSGKDQCTEQYSSGFGCGCPVFVNPDNEEAIANLNRIMKEGSGCISICPAIACVEPVSGTCEPTDNKGEGLCATNQGVPL